MCPHVEIAKASFLNALDRFFHVKQSKADVPIDPEVTPIVMFLEQRRPKGISLGGRKRITLFPLSAMPFTNEVKRNKSTEGA